MSDELPPFDPVWENWPNFLARAPAGMSYKGKDSHPKRNRTSLYDVPSIELYCEKCKGVLPHDWDNDTTGEFGGNLQAMVVVYKCRLCTDTPTLIALGGTHDGAYWTTVKIGQSPPPGTPLSSRLIELLQDDSQLLKKGRRAENHGLGIGAYAYYRRVVENQRNRLFEEVISYAESKSGLEGVAEVFKRAKREKQFSSSLDMVKDHLPDELRIDGRNPFSLLYSKMSLGVHDWTDEKCMKAASAIRTVLLAFATRLDAIRSSDRLLRESIRELDDN